MNSNFKTNQLVTYKDHSHYKFFSYLSGSKCKILCSSGEMLTVGINEISPADNRFDLFIQHRAANDERYHKSTFIERNRHIFNVCNMIKWGVRLITLFVVALVLCVLWVIL